MEDENEQTYVKLVSAEGTEIFLEKRIALQVDTMRAMLEGNFRESEESVIRFPDISDSALEKVVRYLHYKDRHANSTVRIPEFPIEPEEVSLIWYPFALTSAPCEKILFVDKKTNDHHFDLKALELLVAASFLNC